MPLDYRKYPVLFVDDDESNRIIFRAAFGSDFNVLVSRSAEDALMMLREIVPAVIIIDQRLPGMSGIELAELLRTSHPDLIRIMITAYTDLQVAVDAINRGQVSFYIQKPWNKVEVKSFLKNALEQCHLSTYVRELQAQILRAERLATLGMAASSIAHDMGTPVACLLNDLEGLDRDVDEMIDRCKEEPQMMSQLADFQEVVRDCKTSAEEISRILMAVRNSIKGSSVHGPVDLSTIVQTALKLIQTEVIHKATVTLDCANDITVMGDASELTQVVINLLVNAAHAIPAGRQSESRVDVTVKQKDDDVMLSVRDTGCGIAPELRDKIFEPLFTTRVEEGGTGLGLSIIKRIIENHGGKIDVDSVVGRGTIFTITLPLRGY